MTGDQPPSIDQIRAAITFPGTPHIKYADGYLDAFYGLKGIRIRRGGDGIDVAVASYLHTGYPKAKAVLGPSKLDTPVEMDDIQDLVDDFYEEFEEEFNEDAPTSINNPSR